jgi:hypothetical protein
MRSFRVEPFARHAAASRYPTGSSSAGFDPGFESGQRIACKPRPGRRVQLPETARLAAAHSRIAA